MKKHSTQVSGLLLIILWFAPLLFICSIEIKKISIQAKMKDQMANGNVHVLVIPRAEVVWMDKHEIWVNDHMFDIRTADLKDDVYTFTGHYDEEETLLVNRLDRSNKTKNKTDQSLTLVFRMLAFYKENTDQVWLIEAARDDHWVSTSFFLPISLQDVPTPPPRISLVA